MKKRTIFGLTVLALTASCRFAGCGFGSEKDQADQVVAEETPTPEPTQEPEEIAADVSSTTYTSADQSISISLPDATWAVKMDDGSTISFESPEQGKIRILSGQGADTMAAMVLPGSEDMAVTLNQSDDMVNGTDFEIQNYSSSPVGSVNVYSYIVHYLNSDKSDYAYVVTRYIADDNAYYCIEGSAINDASLPGIQQSVDSFGIIADNTLKAAAPSSITLESTDTAEAAAAEAAEAEAAAADTTATESLVDTDASTREYVSDEIISDNTRSRTIYRNSDGKSRVLILDENDGVWKDLDGNAYEFTGEDEAIGPDGTDYWYGGEAADVFYMSPEDDGASE